MIWNVRKQKTNEEKRLQKNEESISSLWDHFKWSNIHIIGVTEGEEKEQEIGNLFERTTKENFPNLVKEINMQVQTRWTESQTRWMQRSPLQDTS